LTEEALLGSVIKPQPSEEVVLSYEKTEDFVDMVPPNRDGLEFAKDVSEASFSA